MRLRNQLLALSLVTLLLPWSGWKLVQELENFLREAEENALLISARTISQAMPAEFQTELKLARGRILPLRQLGTEPIIDGYITEWPQPEQGLVFESPNGDLALDILAGRHRTYFYLALRVADPGDVSATNFNTRAGSGSQRAGVKLYVQNNRGQHSYMLASEAPGPLTVNSQGGTGVRLEANWMDDVDGYTIELVLPGDVERISVGAMAPAFTVAGVSSGRYAGTLAGQGPGEWLELVSRDDDIAHWLARAVPNKSRVWLVQTDGWVVADSGPLQGGDDTGLTWVQRMIYQLVADSRMQLRQSSPPWPVRFEADTLHSAHTDGPLWRRDADSAAVYSLVTVPVFAAGVPDGVTADTIGAVVMETRSEGLLLMTNRALGRFSLVALALVIILAASLWLFATRLSSRVQKLSGAVNRAMDDASHVPELPSTASGDEVGELARNTKKLLKAVVEYTAYLQKLAGRLSHELKTPIAITRSSLENLATSELDPDARQYLERAREGLDRQAAIVSAMSEAQRLEGSVRTAEWETIDVREMLGHCVAGYRAIHPSRTIELDACAEACQMHCAPELIAQALDKLVDNAISLCAEDCDVTLSLRRQEQDCLLSVANSGTCLPDVLHGQLFDSLVSLRDKKAGRSHLGLGLHIVKLVAEAHDGSVSARNLPDDKGVEFTIRLPQRP